MINSKELARYSPACLHTYTYLSNPVQENGASLQQSTSSAHDAQRSTAVANLTFVSDGFIYKHCGTRMAKTGLVKKKRRKHLDWEWTRRPGFSPGMGCIRASAFSNRRPKGKWRHSPCQYRVFGRIQLLDVRARAYVRRERQLAQFIQEAAELDVGQPPNGSLS